jgi:integrating conjugative element membrane protein (TIGR03747 family)
MSNTQHHNSLLIGLFWFITKTILWLLLGALVAEALWVIRLCTMGEPQQLLLLNALTLNELHILNSALVHTSVASNLIGMMVADIHHASIWASGMAQSAGSTNIAIQDQPFVTSATVAVLPSAKALLQVSIGALELTGLRLLNLAVQVPVFVWVGLVGLTDGLVQRELRKFQGGRESALIYHRARSAIFPAVLAGMLLYLALPLTTSPDLLLAPFALLFGMAIALSARAFKKYL